MQPHHSCTLRHRSCNNEHVFVVQERRRKKKKLFLTVLLLCLLSEHQAALLQLKRECKEELEKLQVSMKGKVPQASSSVHLISSSIPQFCVKTALYILFIDYMYVWIIQIFIFRRSTVRNSPDSGWTTRTVSPVWSYLWPSCGPNSPRSGPTVEGNSGTSPYPPETTVYKSVSAPSASRRTERPLSKLQRMGKGQGGHARVLSSRR